MKTRSERGQSTVLTLVFLTVLLGMAALVLDVGSWYRTKRAAQSTADAAALAGAQALPYDTGSATSLALQYSSKNGGGVQSSGIAISNGVNSNDTITVQLQKPAQGVFSKLFGVKTVTVGAKAVARTGMMDKAEYVAPIGVNVLNPKLKGTSSCPCFGAGQPTTLPLGKTGAPGAFDLLNLDLSHGGTSPDILANWILTGYNGYLPLDKYYSDPGAKWNSSQVQNALQQRLGSDLLFPVYDVLIGNGANAQYHVIGWVGFHMTAFSAKGSSGSITGYFTQVIWNGIESTTSNSQPDLGARTVQLIN
ncbi:MAG: pilus assembly protein TadG-related protein [Gaiellaceae bacterium]